MFIPANEVLLTTVLSTFFECPSKTPDPAVAFSESLSTHGCLCGGGGAGDGSCTRRVGCARSPLAEPADASASRAATKHERRLHGPLG